MKRFCYILLSILLLANIDARALVVDEWISYPAMGEVSNVVKADNMLYVLAGSSLYSVNTNDYTVTTYSKDGILSDTEISFIEWCATAKKLVIVYSNQNIDLLTNDGVVENMPDYYSKTMTGDKTVNSVDIYGNDAYLSTGFGIVRIDVMKAEVVNTYIIGAIVGWVHLDNEHIYAECIYSGQFVALLTDNLLDPASWTRTTTTYTPKTVTLDPDLVAEAKAYMPNAPHVGYFAFLKIIDGNLFTVPGKNDTPERVAAVQILNGDEWTVIESETGYDGVPNYRNLCAIDRDPTNVNRWLVAAVPGLYEYTNGTITNCYYCGNSILERAATVEDTNVDYTEVTALCFDNQGNAWMVQAYAPTPGIICLSHDGKFTRYRHSSMEITAGYSWTEPKGLGFDSNGLLWFTNNDYRTPALACYNTATDELTAYTTFVNQDNTTINLSRVRCWAEDVEGNMWIGSDVGPAYISNADLRSGGTTFQQQKIPREDDPTLADYLLSGVDISSIAVDAGNRKWFGTNGDGVYLISADNMEQVAHFTAANSDLLSDNVEALTIDNATGLVYIATDKGLCAYSSAVTETKEKLEKDNVYAYPNPVRPDYDGLVTIVGLTYAAQVCITTTSGHLVKKGTSTGGSFSWDCTDEKGRRVASGVYFVLVSTEDGKQALACKIGVVR